MKPAQHHAHKPARGAYPPRDEPMSKSAAHYRERSRALLDLAIRADGEQARVILLLSAADYQAMATSIERTGICELP